jgi:hypothetical protein
MMPLALASGSPSPLPGFLNSLAGLLDYFGYWAVLLLVIVEDFGIPVPGETVLIAASVRGRGPAQRGWPGPRPCHQRQADPPVRER